MQRDGGGEKKKPETSECHSVVYTLTQCLKGLPLGERISGGRSRSLERGKPYVDCVFFLLFFHSIDPDCTASYTRRAGCVSSLVYGRGKVGKLAQSVN